MTAGLSSSGDGGALTLSSGSGSVSGGAVSLSGGDGSSGTGGSISISSGSGASTTASGAVTMSTSAAGTAGVSGAMTLSTGDATSGDSGSLTMETGDSVGGKGGDVAVSVGSADTGAAGGAMTLSSGSSSSHDGGSIILSAGTSSTLNHGGTISIFGGDSSGIGSNIHLQPGSGVSDGSIIFQTLSGSSFASFSSSSVTFSPNHFDLSAEGTISISADYDISLSSESGINFSDSYIYGFEMGSGTVSASPTNQISLDKMSGSISIPSDSSTDFVTFTMYNSRVTSNSLVFTTFASTTGTNCRPQVKSASSNSGSVDFEIFDYDHSNCSSNIILNYFIVS